MKRYLFCTTIVFSLVFLCNISWAEEPGYGYIKGMVSAGDGQTSSGWNIGFFDAKKGPSPFTLEYWRIADYREHSAEDGRFSKELPEGAYYIVVFKRSDERTSGNPAEGDLIYPPGNEREQKQYVVNAGGTTDVGVISGAVPFQKEWTAQGRTGIEGSIFDENGVPAQGKKVYAYTKPPQEIPLFNADNRTGSDGKYIVRVPEGGQYYLIISGYRHPSPVMVTTGEITKGIDIHIPK